jgi:hypothetical protein
MWLDDIRDPKNHGCADWTWVKTAHGAIQLLLTGDVTVASLDHDLGVAQSMYGAMGQIGPPHDTGSGYDVVLFLEEHPEYWPPEGTYVHSANPAGRARMEQVVLRHYGKLFKRHV